jgi:hypothetical protein
LGAVAAAPVPAPRGAHGFGNGSVFSVRGADAFSILNKENNKKKKENNFDYLHFP